MSVSTLTANADLDADYGAGSPVTLYAALATATPNMTANSGNGTLVEPTTGEYGGYARVALTNDSTSFPAASGGGKQNGVAIDFPASTGGVSSPVVCTHLVFVTSNTGTYRIVDALAISGGVTIGSGQAASFAIGAVTISEA